MPDSIFLPHPVHDDMSEVDLETQAAMDVLAIFYGRIEMTRVAGTPVAELELPVLAARMMQGAAEVWKSVDKRAFNEAESRLVEIAVEAILAIIACRRVTGP